MLACCDASPARDLHGAPRLRSSPGADMILRHGAIYTMDGARSWAESVAISGGKIVAVGPDSDILKWRGRSTKVLDLGGKMVLPGFHDSHVHLAEGGVELGQCSLDKATDKEEILRLVAEYAAKNPKKEWILGGGWSLTAFPQANPLKDDLDKIVPDRPVFLYSQDGHSAWANSPALKLMGIDERTKDPPRGRIERYADSKKPSGTLREFAVDLVQKKVPQPSRQEYLDGVRRAMRLANSYGITTVHEANTTEDMLESYRELDRSGEVTLNVVAALKTDPSRGAEQVKELMALRNRYSGGHIRATAAKIFSDGVIEAHTAALLEPYTDKPGEKGILNLEPNNFSALVAELDRCKFQVHIHAIGDRGVRAGLNALEFAQKQNGLRDSRHQMAHLELIHPSDLPRFAKLGVVANYEPFWAYRDSYIKDLTEPLIGPERSSRLYQIHSMLKTGAVVSAGSDWTVSTLNPLEAIQVAVTRCGLNETSGEPLIREEQVDLAQILAAYTINGAYVNGQDKRTGSIEVGKAADLIVVDRNLFSIAPREIHKARVLFTLFNGREVFRDRAFPLSIAARD
ncbi:MAG TPA: amidohydrolase [Candidatus Obscuribacterales bacterium]